MATTVTVGGKGSSLSSSAVYYVSTGASRLRIDSSALEKLSFSGDSPTTPSPSSASASYPPFLSPQELRASLVLLLRRLLHSPSVPLLPLRISESLHRDPLPSDLLRLPSPLLEALPLSVLCGVSALLDHSAAALSSVIDAVAALSCEASLAPVKGAFDLTDSGDGNAEKDAVAVASDLTVLLNNSKLVNKDKFAASEVAQIPNIHACLRGAAKTLHSRLRVWLNFVEKPQFDAANGKTVVAVLSSLARAVRSVGEGSFCRAKMNLESVADANLRGILSGLFEEKCPSCGSLTNGFKSVLDADLLEDYQMYVHQTNELLGMVWEIVTWEGITAFVSLEGGDIGEKNQGVDANGGDAQSEKKGDKKKKKKKKLLGNGTEVLVQFIRDRLQKRMVYDVVDVPAVLQMWVQCIYSLLDPKGAEFNSFVEKIREIVDSNASRRLPKLPKGTRDFGKEQMAIRKKAFTIIEGVFERHGASALDTPVFELRETLMGKYGEDSKLIYDLADQGGELCSLRYDLTVPFARYVAMHGITSLKRYQIAKVYRRDNPSKGRYREFYQCDFDIAGKFEPMGPDFEVVKILTELLDELDIGDYEIKLNHRKLLDGMLEICGVRAEKFRTICSSIDKLDKQSFEQVKKEMVEEKGLSVETADRIGNFVKERGSPLELLSKLKQDGSEFLQNEDANSALSDLEILFKALNKSKCINKVVFDLSLARGLDYYTGVIFEAVFKGTTQVGSIAAGGRYDNLIGMFGSKQVPAVGVSLGIERVFTIMEQLQKERKESIRATKTQVLVSILGDDVSQGAELASELWNAKLEAEFMVNKRVNKHIDRALESRIPWMVLVGERELNAGIVKLKNIEANQEGEVPRSHIVDELKKRLRR